MNVLHFPVIVKIKKAEFSIGRVSNLANRALMHAEVYLRFPKATGQYLRSSCQCRKNWSSASSSSYYAVCGLPATRHRLSTPRPSTTEHRTNGNAASEYKASHLPLRTLADANNGKRASTRTKSVTRWLTKKVRTWRTGIRMTSTHTSRCALLASCFTLYTRSVIVWEYILHADYSVTRLRYDRRD